MQISTIAPTTTMGAHRAFAPTPLQAPPHAGSAAVDTTPPKPATAAEIARRYEGDLFELPGVTMISTSENKRNEVRITMRDNASAAFAAGVIEKVVEGVKLVLMVDSLPYKGPERGDITQRLRAIEAMRGVWDRNWSSAPKPNPDTSAIMTFSTIDEATTKRLDLLVRDRIEVGFNPETKQPVYLDIRWKSGVPQR